VAKAHPLCRQLRQRITVYPALELEQLEPVPLTHLLRDATRTLDALAGARDDYLRAHWVRCGKLGRFAWASDPVYVELSDIWRSALDEVWKLERALVTSCLRTWLPVP